MSLIELYRQAEDSVLGEAPSFTTNLAASLTRLIAAGYLQLIMKLVGMALELESLMLMLSATRLLLLAVLLIFPLK